MADAFTVYVVEDDDYYGEMLQYFLSLDPEISSKRFATGKDLMDNLSKRPQVITLDYRLPDMTGEDILRKVKDYDEEIEVIIVSEQESIATAVELLKLGAYDYLEKGNDLQDRLLNTLHNLRRQEGLKGQIRTLRQEVSRKYSFQNSIIGASKPMLKVFNLMEKAAMTNITVSVTGETGTGKELVAKAIHYNSKRKDQTLVAVNMAAIPPDLIESELFGHEKGAFTGALNRRVGKFEEAHQGTLFLDEIAELDLTLQAKLLRVLQEREVTRIGSNTPVPIDVRIIVATHQNLLNLVKEGKFRQDLYYRLIGLPIELPPLRERGNDILILAKYFVQEFCTQNELDNRVFSNEAQRKLLSYAWPGNVRELKSVVELGVVMANGSEIEAEDLVLNSDDLLPGLMTEDLTLKEYTHRIINSLLDKYEGNIKLVAEKLDIGQSTIYRMLKAEKDKKTS